MIPTESNGRPIGTASDMAARLRMTLPNGWFPASPPAPAASLTPVLDGVLAGLAAAWSFCFGLLSIAASQARLATAYGVFLDLISADFFADALPRQVGEPDSSFRSRISQNLVNSRATRDAVAQAVLTSGLPSPVIVEPGRAPDCGSYGSAATGGAAARPGYGDPGLRYGCNQTPFQYLLQVTPSSSFAPTLSCQRQSSATFIDEGGSMQLVGPNVLRPAVSGSVVQGPLIEARSFNLIESSRDWGWLAHQENGGWSIQVAGNGLLASDATVGLVVPAGESAASIYVDVAAGGQTITGSVWANLRAGNSLVSVQLALTDLTTGTRTAVSADMNTIGTWQRIAVTAVIVAAPGRTARMSLEINGGEASSVVTQCWQVEPGSTATSYIPTTGLLGIRNEDVGMTVTPSSEAVVLDRQQLFSAVSGTIPAATVAWVAYLDAL